MLQVKNLNASFGEFALKDISFSLAHRERLGILGESGSGKSLLSQVILGLATPSKLSGEILFENRVILGDLRGTKATSTTTNLANNLATNTSQSSYAKDLPHLRGRHIAYIPQSPLNALNPLHTIQKQIGEMFAIHKEYAKSAKERETLIDEALHKVGLPKQLKSRFPHELSGGQRQRALIAMMSVLRPKVLIYKKVFFENSVACKLNGYNTFSGCAALTDVNFAYLSLMSNNSFSGCTALTNLTFIPKSISTNLYFGSSPVLTETSCLNIINSIADGAKISVSLHSAVKTCMANDWYCKLENGVYVSCTSEDDGAMLQTAALIARGGTLA